MDIQVKNASKIMETAARVPAELSHFLRQAFERSMTRYKSHHARRKMHASPPPSWRGRAPAAAGLLATKRRAGNEGLLSAFHIESGGTQLADMYAKLYTRHIIAVRHETGGSWAPGWIPLPPAKDARGRTKASVLAKWNTLKTIIRKRDGKEFKVAPNPAYKRLQRTYRKKRKGWLGFMARKPSSSQRWLWLFHRSPHILRPRLAFISLWKGFYPEVRKAFIGALRMAVARAGRGR